MNKIEWDSRFLLGFKDIDQHHQHLVGLLSRSYDEFVSGAPNLGPTLEELLDYTKYHFKSEELWMLDGFYPAIIEHKNAHSFFLLKVTQMREAYHSGSECLSLEMLQFLGAWITNHILKTDAEFGKFLCGTSP